jgi:hypothetical protein
MAGVLAQLIGRAGLLQREQIVEGGSCCPGRITTSGGSQTLGQGEPSAVWTVGSANKGVKIREIGHLGQTHHSNLQAPFPQGLATGPVAAIFPKQGVGCNSHRILLGRTPVPPKARPRQLGSRCSFPANPGRGCNSSREPRNLLMDNAPDQGPFFRVPAVECAHHMGQRPPRSMSATSQVGDPQMQGNPHVRQVSMFEVHLCRTACPLAKDPVVLLLQASKGFFDRLPGRRKPALVILSGAVGAHRPLRSRRSGKSGLPWGFRRIGFISTAGGDPGSPSLQSLRVGDLFALWGDIGV